MTCKCYHAERNFLGKIGVCWGTKECEACSCGGDESKCDFYEDKRKKATPKATNADRIRAMSDEELAKAMSKLIGFPCGGCPVKTLCKQMPNDASCITVLTVWLKEEAEE